MKIGWIYSNCLRLLHNDLGPHRASMTRSTRRALAVISTIDFGEFSLGQRYRIFMSCYFASMSDGFPSMWGWTLTPSWWISWRFEGRNLALNGIRLAPPIFSRSCVLNVKYCVRQTDFSRPSCKSISPTKRRPSILTRSALRPTLGIVENWGSLYLLSQPLSVHVRLHNPKVS